jgi:Large ribosomal RNA subunit accumulation protein YceD
MRKSIQPATGHPWRVIVVQAGIPGAGLHLDIAANEKVRADIAALAGVERLPRLEASFDVTRHGRSGLRVIGRVSATVGQTCGVTLEPVENEVEEALDLVFLPSPAQVPGEHERKDVAVPFADAPEALIDGAIDLGALATEFLVLGVDPYPRKRGSVFAAPTPGEGSAHPFAALSVLKKHPRSRKG